MVLGQTPEEEVEEFNNQWGIVLADQIPALDGFLLGLGLGGLLAPPPGDVITAALGWVSWSCSRQPLKGSKRFLLEIRRELSLIILRGK